MQTATRRDAYEIQQATRFGPSTSFPEPQHPVPEEFAAWDPDAILENKQKAEKAEKEKVLEAAEGFQRLQLDQETKLQRYRLALGLAVVHEETTGATEDGASASRCASNAVSLVADVSDESSNLDSGHNFKEDASLGEGVQVASSANGYGEGLQHGGSEVQLFPDHTYRLRKRPRIQSQPTNDVLSTLPRQEPLTNRVTSWRSSVLKMPAAVEGDGANLFASSSDVDALQIVEGPLVANARLVEELRVRAELTGGGDFEDLEEGFKTDSEAFSSSGASGSSDFDLEEPVIGTATAVTITNFVKVDGHERLWVERERVGTMALAGRTHVNLLADFTPSKVRAPIKALKILGIIP